MHTYIHSKSITRSQTEHARTYIGERAPAAGWERRAAGHTYTSPHRRIVSVTVTVPLMLTGYLSNTVQNRSPRVANFHSAVTVPDFGSSVPADITRADMARARTRITARPVCGGPGQQPAQNEDPLRVKGSGSMTVTGGVFRACQ